MYFLDFYVSKYMAYGYAVWRTVYLKVILIIEIEVISLMIEIYVFLFLIKVC